MSRNVLMVALAALVAALVGGIVSLAAPGEAEAAYPGDNGRIVYVNDTCGEGCAELHAQGLGEATSVEITANYRWNAEPSYAYGGERIVFIHDDDIAAVPSSGGAPEVLLRDTDGPFGRYTFGNPSLSPDGGTLLYRTFDQDTYEGSVYTVPVSGGEPTLIAGGDGRSYHSPEWSPDGSRISYYVNSAGKGTIFTVPASGGAPALVTDAAFDGDHSWSPDGGRVAFVGRDNSRNLNVLYTVPASGGGAPRPVYESPAYLHTPAYSPDGRYIAFASGSIFVVPSGGGAAEQVTHGRYGASQPDWQPLCPCPAPPGPDEAKPTVTRPGPAPGAEVRDRTPAVGATVRDGESELAASNIRLHIDGSNKPFAYDQNTDRLSRAAGRLSYGRHTVRVSAEDAAGNAATRSWSFRVVRGR